MKNLLCTALSLLLILTLQAQNTETRNVGSFDGLHVSSSFDVIVKKGNRESVRLEISGVDLNEIRTEVNGGTLKIYRKSKAKNWYKNSKGKIYVTYRELDEIHSSGSADVYCADPLKARSFEATTSGSGNMILEDLEADELMTRISGSSDLEIAGSVETQEVNISGSGDYDAMDLDCEEAHVRVSGSGNARITARESLKASVSGSGDISYRGSPDHVDTRTSGSGSVRKVR
ncbi:MAG: head GIN domain-containing protein [Bacteroidota bacterium]